MLHLVLVHNISSDLDAEAIIRIVNEVDDPADAARALVKVSAELWAEKNDYCDDITAIVIFIGGKDSGGSVERPVEFYCGSKQKSSMSSLFRSVFRCVVKRKGKRVNGNGDLSLDE